MLTKTIWRDALFDLKMRKYTYKKGDREYDIFLFIGICLLPLASLLCIFTDLLFLPFEIGFYFFEKWLEK